MALVKLAVVQNNLGNFVKRDEYGKRAVEHVDRLTPRERYYIEGFYYALHPETYARSIEAYTQGLALHPEHQASRHNLALMFQILERFPEAIAQNEELIRRGTSNPTTYENLSEILIFTGDPKRAREVAEDFLRRFPESPAGLRSLGSALLAEGRLDEALEAFRKSEALNPADFQPRLGRRAIANLRGDWAAADAVSDEMIARPAGIERFIGWIGKSVISAAQGRGRDAAAQLTTAIAQPGIAPFLRAGQRNTWRGCCCDGARRRRRWRSSNWRWSRASTATRSSRRSSSWPFAQAALGRKEASAASLARLEARAKALVGQREARRVDWARGEIALGAGDAVTAATALKAAQQALPPHGPTLGPPGAAYLAALLSRGRLRPRPDGMPTPPLCSIGCNKATSESTTWTLTRGASTCAPRSTNAPAMPSRPVISTRDSSDCGAPAIRNAAGWPDGGEERPRGDKSARAS
jgi:hypothetical protein